MNNMTPTNPTRKDAYKIKAYDEVHDIHLLYRKVWWVFYKCVGCGSKQKLDDIIKGRV